MSILNDPISLGAIDLKNRFAMAPMTRNRANGDGTHTDMAPTYYGQRASAGLIISEATQVEFGGGGLNTPGIYNEAQTAAWKKAVDAVHAEGGKIIAQLWHVGRISTAVMTDDGKAPRAPSAVQADYETVTKDGRVKCDMPRAYTDAEIWDVVESHRIAAECAKAAGFDGIELHAANGYLIEQFIQDRTNQRDDDWGGTAQKRTKFMTEILDRVCAVWGADRVGVRLSPLGKFNDMGDSDPLGTYTAQIEAMNPCNLAFLHMVETFPGTETTPEEQAILDKLKATFNGKLIINGGFDKASAEGYLNEGKADVIAFGRPFISNPDLVARYAADAPLNELDGEKIYGGDHRGYTDYPTLAQAASTANA